MLPAGAHWMLCNGSGLPLAQVVENTVDLTNMVAGTATEGASKIVEAGKSITSDIFDGTGNVSCRKDQLQLFIIISVENGAISQGGNFVILMSCLTWNIFWLYR